jgi:hypothetical protein
MKSNRAGDLAWRRRVAMAGLVGWLAVAGCHTKPAQAPRVEVPRGYLNTMPGNAANPGVAQPPLPAIVGEVLAAHGFPPPQAIQGSEGSVWAVSARPRSATEVSLVSIQMSPRGEVTVEIAGRAHVGSSWAILGERFQEPENLEAQAMEKQIQEKLRGSPP